MEYQSSGLLKSSIAIDNKSQDERFILLEKMNSINKEINDFEFRFLHIDDINKSYFNLLSELTVSPVPNENDWKYQVKNINESNIYTVVIDDKKKNIIVGNITCIIENKFIRNLGKVSHIEDVVVLTNYRHKKLGSKLINLIIEFSKDLGCYKVILDGRMDAIDFYKKFGFEKKFNCMAYYP